MIGLSGCSSTETADTASADNANEIAAQELVTRAKMTVETIYNNKDFVAVKDVAARAKGIMIFPQLVKAGFLVGGEGGKGVVLAKQEDGSWSYPAFYNMVGGSIGLQIGVESSEIVFLIMNQKAMDAVVKNQFKLGADVSVALGPFGAGLGADKSSPNLAADMYVYSKGTGLFTGGAFKGAIITKRDDLNTAYYNREAQPHDILFGKDFMNSNADELRSALAQEPPVNNQRAVPITPVQQY
jgi:lipid-binding SYLF domain-containing protein